MTRHFSQFVAAALTAVALIAGGGTTASAQTHGVAHAGPATQRVTVTDAAGRRLATTSTVRPSAVAPDTESSIICGGAKHGSGWFALSYGGYVGQGCGAGTDHVVTPTSSYAIYDFGISDGTALAYQAWIPVNADADAVMDFTLYACGSAIADTTVNQALVGGWTDLFDPTDKNDINSLWYWSIQPGCDVQVKAWTGQATSGLYMGLDAIRTVS